MFFKIFLLWAVLFVIMRGCKGKSIECWILMASMHNSIDQHIYVDFSCYSAAKVFN